MLKVKNNHEVVATKSNPSTSSIIDEAECLRRVPVSRRTWFEWRAQGKIPTIKIGRRCLYHWKSVEEALLRLQRGGLMIIPFLFAALATLAMGHAIILEACCLQAQAALVVVCDLPLGTTNASQITNQNANVVKPGNVNAEARGLPGVVAATMMKLDHTPNYDPFTGASQSRQPLFTAQ